MNLEQSIATLDNDSLFQTVRRERIRQAAIRAGIYAEKNDNIAVCQRISDIAETEAGDRGMNIAD